MPPFAQILLAQSTPTDTTGGPLALVAALVPLAVLGLVIAGLWKVFTKAGKPGWAALIPIYNVIVLLQIAERPAWWVVLLIVPLVNLVVTIVVAFDIARNFGKGTGFALGLAFLGFICYPLLGFSNARYQPATT